ncbi:acid protease [Violaceomyces palustris]|uniref:Acid protease n=1 Tax=Violaceomyces palustris TaxID=1673888 RepID=A0ACD0P1E5_9BASI|nr:acid protease [Violaceomyces palustris]
MSSSIKAVSLATLLLLASAAGSLAAPASAAGEGASNPSLSIPIVRRTPKQRTLNETMAWANAHRAHLQSKYNIGRAKGKQKERRDGAATLINLEHDSTWLAPVQGGTPSQTFNVVLDTGSSDLWLDQNKYSPSSSSSFSNVSTPFSIKYGSGEVAGYLATDDFSLAGTTVDGLTFAVADEISQGLLDSNIAGIMGMAFQRLSSSGAQPFWEKANIDTFSFFLNRDIVTSSNYNRQESYGGIFTLGGTNSSLYTGAINYIDVIEELYWMLNLGGVTAHGSSVDLGSTTKAAIDTGTTLIGGPDSVIENLYAQIPGSSALSGSEGYYTYPCSTTVNATLTFGNKQYQIADVDMQASVLDNSGTVCMGAFFGAGTSSLDDLQWIVGDSFLKSVYSVFTTSGGSARIGFASLASGLNSGTTSTTVNGATSTSSSALSFARPSPLAFILVVASGAIALGLF